MTAPKSTTAKQAPRKRTPKPKPEPEAFTPDPSEDLPGFDGVPEPGPEQEPIDAETADAMELARQRANILIQGDAYLTPDQQERLRIFTEAFREVGVLVYALLPDGRRQSLAATYLEQAFNAAAAGVRE